MARRPADAVRLFRCLECGAEEGPETDHSTCPACGGNLDMVWDFDDLRRLIDRDAIDRSTDDSLWRFHPLLPLHDDFGPPPLRVGGTPLYETAALARRVGIERLYVKDDTGNPTASFKDRASLVAALRAKECGIATVACASTGNAAASLAGIAAALGMESIIFLPADAPPAKLTQIRIAGARIFRVRGSYDDAFDLCEKAAARFGWYSRSTGVNPYTVEGKKTAAFEIARALRWETPDVVIVPTGDGNILGGIGKGFFQMKELGWIERVPRLIAVQAEGASPLVTAFETNGAVKPIRAKTVADSISVGHPRDAVRALAMLKETNGAALAVSDGAILEAIRTLASHTGIFAEPSAAASLAGAEEALRRGLVGKNERVVLLVTGHGLKDVAATSSLLPMPPEIDADLDSVARRLAGGGGKTA